MKLTTILKEFTSSQVGELRTILNASDEQKIAHLWEIMFKFVNLNVIFRNNLVSDNSVLSNVLEEAESNWFANYDKGYITDMYGEDATDEDFVGSDIYHEFVDEYFYQPLSDIRNVHGFANQGVTEFKDAMERIIFHDIIAHGGNTKLADLPETALEYCSIMASEHPDIQPHAFLPSWFWLVFENDVKNQWIIHFTDQAVDANDILKNGFKRGMPDPLLVGWSTGFSTAENEDSALLDSGDDEKYVFGYTLRDAYLYALSDGGYPKYGLHGLVFKASGIRCWHIADEEHQTIISSNLVRDIIPLHSQNKEFSIRHKNGKILHKGELSDMLDWIEMNYSQYKNVIVSSFDED
jgi:hypothetical protein